MALTKVDTSMVESSGAFGRRNILINGDFGIYQRAQQVTGLAGSENYFTADRWVLNGNLSSGRLTMTAGTEAAPPESNVTTSLKLDCTTADTSLGAGEALTIQQRVEGYNLQHVKKGTSGAKELTASFWVKSETGTFTYVLELYDADNTRQVSKSFSVTSSWSKVELTFPADTTGAFGNDANTSLYFQIYLASGTNLTSGTLNQTWNSITNANRAVGVSNFVSSTSNEFYITAVQLEVGDAATEFEILTRGEMGKLCERYFIKLTQPHMSGIAVGTSNSNIGRMGTALPTSMRGAPTCALSAGINVYQGTNTGTTTGVQAQYNTEHAIEFDFTSNMTNDEAGRACISYQGGSSTVSVDAEL